MLAPSLNRPHEAVTGARATAVCVCVYVMYHRAGVQCVRTVWVCSAAGWSPGVVCALPLNQPRPRVASAIAGTRAAGPDVWSVSTATLRQVPDHGSQRGAGEVWDVGCAHLTLARKNTTNCM